MGLPMCERLLRAGFALTVYTRTSSKAQQLLDQGALWAESPVALAEKADVICTMVGFPKDVRDVYLSKDGLLYPTPDLDRWLWISRHRNPA